MIELLSLAILVLCVLQGVTIHLLRSKPNPLAEAYAYVRDLSLRQSVRIDELVDTLGRMRREGFVQSQVIVEPPRRQPLPSDILKALEAVGESGLEDEVRGWYEDGLDEQSIIDQILRGGSVPLI